MDDCLEKEQARVPGGKERRRRRLGGDMRHDHSMTLR
jgi:hypothetical protein